MARSAEGDHTLEKFRRQLERSFYGMPGVGLSKSTFPDWAAGSGGPLLSPDEVEKFHEEINRQHGGKTDNEKANQIFPVVSEDSNAAEPLPWVFPFHQFPISPAAAGYVPGPADSHPKAGEPDPPTLPDRVRARLRPAVAERVEGQSEIPQIDPEERKTLADKIYQTLGLRHGTPAGDLASWASHGLITKILTEVIEKVCDHYGLTRKETIALNVALFFLYREVLEPDGMNFDSIMDVLLPAAVAAAEILWEER